MLLSMTEAKWIILVEVIPICILVCCIYSLIELQIYSKYTSLDTYEISIEFKGVQSNYKYY